ncbi:MAG TPA: ferredoxin family protein [Gemmataceae bacterium]|nr:ferredoxin family protein [Gemmataceae bacterium]
MSRHRLTVVLSQAPGKNPTKRALEESIVAALITEPGLDVSVVPYLYDLDANHTGRLFLESITGDMVVLAWMFPRAAFWVLDRDGIKGHFGESRLKPPAADDDEEDGEPEPPRGIGSVNVPDRYIYCLDLRDFASHEPYVQEVRRIAEECRQRYEAKQRERAQANPPLVQLGLSVRADEPPSPPPLSPAAGERGRGEGAPHFKPEDLLKPPERRWYPVIDYSRCTNCMECIDFCLFGVYGVDQFDRIFVENQDNCKRGCPACSRVCPEHAIMFPDYKTPAIAGAPVGGISGLKIDLTKLFGGDDAIKIAAAERDRELIKDGRQAVGLTVGIPKRQAAKPQQPKDDLDKLVDSLDALDI